MSCAVRDGTFQRGANLNESHKDFRHRLSFRLCGCHSPVRQGKVAAVAFRACGFGEYQRVWIWGHQHASAIWQKKRLVDLLHNWRGQNVQRGLQNESFQSGFDGRQPDQVFRRQGPGIHPQQPWRTLHAEATKPGRRKNLPLMPSRPLCIRNAKLIDNCLRPPYNFASLRFRQSAWMFAWKVLQAGSLTRRWVRDPDCNRWTTAQGRRPGLHLLVSESQLPRGAA